MKPTYLERNLILDVVVIFYHKIVQSYQKHSLNSSVWKYQLKVNFKVTRTKIIKVASVALLLTLSAVFANWEETPNELSFFTVNIKDTRTSLSVVVVSLLLTFLSDSRLAKKVSFICFDKKQSKYNVCFQNNGKRFLFHLQKLFSFTRYLDFLKSLRSLFQYLYF